MKRKDGVGPRKLAVEEGWYNRKHGEEKRNKKKEKKEERGWIFTRPLLACTSTYMGLDRCGSKKYTKKIHAFVPWRSVIRSTGKRIQRKGHATAAAFGGVVAAKATLNPLSRVER